MSGLEAERIGFRGEFNYKFEYERVVGWDILEVWSLVLCFPTLQSNRENIEWKVAHQTRLLLVEGSVSFDAVHKNDDKNTGRRWPQWQSWGLILSSNCQDVFFRIICKSFFNLLDCWCVYNHPDKHLILPLSLAFITSTTSLNTRSDI